VGALELAMRGDIARVAPRAKPLVERVAWAAGDRNALNVPADTSVDEVSSAVDDPAIKAKKSMLLLSRLIVL
jgi:hypothetical protein